MFFIDASGGEKHNVYFYLNGYYKKRKKVINLVHLKFSKHQAALGNVWRLELSPMCKRHFIEFMSVSLFSCL